MPNSIKMKFEHAIGQTRFSMPKLHADVWPDLMRRPAMRLNGKAIRELLNERHALRLERSILRQVFLIELVKKPKIETTKFQVRWCNELLRDQRGCQFAECIQILDKLTKSLIDRWLPVPEKIELLKLFLDYNQPPYEVPIDYADVPCREDTTTKIHRVDNLDWTISIAATKAVRLRKYLCDSATSPDVMFFRKVLDDKIKIKTYLTDRVLTGSHKTNREKRWEVHPHSVHFATRMNCLSIEHALVSQICAFDGFPEQARQQLIDAKVLDESERVFRCPITLIPMSFEVFQNELLNPVHGRSLFQVGHLNPLKLGAPEATASGHTADNVSWISADGNRIQGSMGLAEVRDLLHRIIRNYEEQGFD